MKGVLRGRRVAWAVCAVQALIAGATAAAFYGSGDSRQALAALYGGAVALVPAAYLGAYLLSPSPEATARQVVSQFYRGAVGKIAITAALFALGVWWFAPQFGALIAAFIACQAAYWLVLVLWRVA